VDDGAVKVEGHTIDRDMFLILGPKIHPSVSPEQWQELTRPVRELSNV
jgi:hypothetical protein